MMRPLCAAHMLAAHRDAPFHIFKSWGPRSSFWTIATYSDLGGILTIGHRGRRGCNLPGNTRTLTVVHEQGIYEMSVRFCRCNTAATAESEGEEAQQLLRHGLWPASWIKPRTAYSLRVMEEFDRLGVLAHANAYDYFKYLCRLTDDLLPMDAPVRYRGTSSIKATDNFGRIVTVNS